MSVGSGADEAYFHPISASYAFMCSGHYSIFLAPGRPSIIAKIDSIFNNSEHEVIVTFELRGGEPILTCHVAENSNRDIDAVHLSQYGHVGSRGSSNCLNASTMFKGSFCGGLHSLTAIKASKASTKCQGAGLLV